MRSYGLTRIKSRFFTTGIGNSGHWGRSNAYMRCLWESGPLIEQAAFHELEMLTPIKSTILTPDEGGRRAGFPWR